MSELATTLTRASVPRAGGNRYLLTPGDTSTISVTVRAEFVDEPSERGYVSQLWSEDWDSVEDSIYDRE